MKLLYQSKKFKRYNQRHAYKLFSRKQDYKAWRKYTNSLKEGLPKDLIKAQNEHRNNYWSYDNVCAPQHFSFINNPKEVIKFISILESYYEKRKRVYVDLSHVIEIDYSTVVVLLAIMFKFKASNIKFNGNFPLKKEARTIIKQSGFADYLNNDIKNQQQYAIEHKGSGIHTHANKDVDSTLTAKLIEKASDTVWGERRRCQGVQRTLIELMQNTNNHADMFKTGEKHWWLSVNHQKSENKVMFAFIDFGIGIFESLNNKPQNNKFYNICAKLKNRITYGNNAELLKLIVQGELHRTVTEKHWRGKGLPGVVEAFERNQISRLHLITNNVFANILEDEFYCLDKSFSGTFIYWEVNQKNESCK